MANPKSSEQIREEIKRLKDQLSAAEAEEKERARKQIVRAAERAGLVRLALRAEVLEREFRAVAARCQSETLGIKSGSLRSKIRSRQDQAAVVSATAQELLDRSNEPGEGA